MTAPSPDPGALLDRLEEARQALQYELQRAGVPGWTGGTDDDYWRQKIDRVFALLAYPELLRLARQGEALRVAVVGLAEQLEAPVFRAAVLLPDRDMGRQEGADAERIRVAARLRRLVADTTGGA